MRGLVCYQIDAFTSQPFAGNPAAVVLLPRSALPLPDAVRQAVAAEKNLSETAFLECAGDDGSDDFSACTRFRLRWFTPAIEVPLCGHATLASAAALLFGEGNPAEQLTFETLSGELRVSRQRAAAGSSGGGGGGSSGRHVLSMDLPLVPASAADVPPGMEAGSALVQAAVGSLPVRDVLYAPALRYLFIVLDAGVRDAFHQLSPDNQKLKDAHTGGQLVGVIVSVQGDGERHHFLSRFFAPWAGIAEDPVTGSAHSVLGPYWAAALGTASLRARQCSPRGGELGVEVRAEEGRVVVSGSAVTVFKGHLFLPD
ncbi:hypothetical protein ABPG75_009704 [Micractinium tetrahymenae]